MPSVAASTMFTVTEAVALPAVLKSEANKVEFVGSLTATGRSRSKVASSSVICWGLGNNHDVSVDACRLPTLKRSSNDRRKSLVSIIIYSFDQSSSHTLWLLGPLSPLTKPILPELVT